MSSTSASSALDRYTAAATLKDIDALVVTLREDIELISPLSGRMVFRGRPDAHVLLTAVYSGLSDVRWGPVIGEGDTRVSVLEGRMGPVHFTDAMVFDLAPDGLILRIRPHFRPWLALTYFALTVGPRLAVHPGVLRRALR